ncbi:MAG TPA: glycosyltransferase family 39 protein [Dehalococcoidia bacterium]|nr:glycosyltransferase family 39 protein [Dehalococcoidia bacterium]
MTRTKVPMPAPPPLPGLTRSDVFFLLGLALIPILLYLPFAGMPFERDEGVYATIAQGVLDGQVPYRDLFDNKPPLVYIWYAFSFTLFGESVFAPRILAAICLSLTTVALFNQARMVLPMPAARIAAALFAISTGLPWVALHANTEAYMLLPLVSSLMFFTIGMRDGRLRWFLIAGALAGLAVMTKQVAMWNLLALAMVALVWHRRTAETSLQWIAPTGALFAGTLASLALVALPFTLMGALDDLIYANLSYNWLYINFLSYAERLSNFGYGLLFFSAVAAPFVVGALVGLVILCRKRAAVMDYVLILWAVASAIGVASGGRFFPHYFLQLMPSLAVLTGIVIYDRFVNGSSHLISRPAWIIATFLIVVSVATTSVLYLAPQRAQEQVVSSVYHQKEWEASSEELGAYIKERTSEDDLIFNYGRESQIYFYADRSPAIAYFYDWVLEFDEELFPEVLTELHETKPVYFIDSVQAPLFDDWQAAHPQGLRDFLGEYYDYQGRIYFADVYRLKTAPPLNTLDLSVPAGSSEFNAFMADNNTFE